MAKDTLGCGRCGAHQPQSLDEGSRCDLHLTGFTLLYCPQCRQATPWRYFGFDRRASKDRRLKPRGEPLAPPERAAAPAPPASPAPPVPSGDPLADVARSLLERRSSWERRGLQQRVHPRVPLELLMRLSVQNDGAFLEITRTMNVGRGGVYFNSDYPYQKNQPVGVQLSYAEVMAKANPEQPGRIVRVDLLPTTVRRGIAVKLH